jgi:hypothetical protein
MTARENETEPIVTDVGFVRGLLERDSFSVDELG